MSNYKKALDILNNMTAEQMFELFIDLENKDTVEKIYRVSEQWLIVDDERELEEYDENAESWNDELRQADNAERLAAVKALS